MKEDHSHLQLKILEQGIHEILKQYPVGLSEYDLMEALGETGAAGFDGGGFDNDLSMFQCHFLLFHCLYGLQDRLWADEQTSIDIRCLNIKLNKSTSSESTCIDKHDPLREYYLDLNNLNSTTEDDVHDLLGKFWERFVAVDYRVKALEILGLDEPVSYEEVRVQYKRLAMEHHPDRGGDKEKLQLINEAMQQLKMYYR